MSLALVPERTIGPRSYGLDIVGAFVVTYCVYVLMAHIVYSRSTSNP